ncbi:MAG: hypothetical protein QOE84_3194 [Actinomycetota bacterium]|jgi:hypothetical protein|nr:hypothetical protein [Actinomycetota bacterium]
MYVQNYELYRVIDSERQAEALASKRAAALVSARRWQRRVERANRQVRLARLAVR